MRHTPTVRGGAMAALLLLLASCAGTPARENVLWPQVVSAWPVVLEYIEAGVGEDPEPLAIRAAINQVEGAIQADDYALLLGLNWDSLAMFARAGVANSGVSEGVAASLNERIAQFSQAMQELIR